MQTQTEEVATPEAARRAALDQALRVPRSTRFPLLSSDANINLKVTLAFVAGFTAGVLIMSI